MFFCSLVYMYSVESENNLGWTITPLWGERSWIGVGEWDLCFLNFDSGQAVAVIKLGGGTRWVRRWHTSSFVDAHVRSGRGIHQTWWRQALSLTEAGLWLSSSFVGLIQLSFLVVVSSLGVVSSCVFVVPLVFSFRPLVFLLHSLVFLFRPLVLLCLRTSYGSVLSCS